MTRPRHWFQGAIRIVVLWSLCCCFLHLVWKASAMTSGPLDVSIWKTSSHRTKISPLYLFLCDFFIIPWNLSLLCQHSLAWKLPVLSKHWLPEVQTLGSKQSPLLFCTTVHSPLSGLQNTESLHIPAPCLFLVPEKSGIEALGEELWLFTLCLCDGRGINLSEIHIPCLGPPAAAAARNMPAAGAPRTSCCTEGINPHRNQYVTCCLLFPSAPWNLCCRASQGLNYSQIYYTSSASSRPFSVQGGGRWCWILLHIEHIRHCIQGIWNLSCYWWHLASNDQNFFFNFKWFRYRELLWLCSCGEKGVKQVTYFEMFYKSMNIVNYSRFHLWLSAKERWCRKLIRLVHDVHMNH